MFRRRDPRDAAGRLHPLHWGVYAVGHASVTLDGCYMAAVKACGELAVLALRSGGVLLDVLKWEDRYPDVMVLGDRAPRHERINGHRTAFLPAAHVTRVRGIPVTTAERTLVTALHGPGPRRGRKMLARIVGTEAAPTQSELEDVVLGLVLRGGLIHPAVNEPSFLDGRRVVPDLCWPHERLVIEADGPHHDDPFERAADRERQRILEAHGYRVIRVTWGQAVIRPAETIRRLADAGAPRRAD